MFPRDLEAVLLKALSPRRGQRYQTMSDLAAGLQAFADAHGLDVRPASLAAMMREAFGGPLLSSATDPGDGGAVDPEPQGGALPQVQPRPVAVTWAPGPDSPPRVAPAGAGARAPTVTRHPAGPVEVVSIVGRLTEAFRGAELGASLSGDVVLDLSGVERVTSFGVREWLAMNQAATVNSLYLHRCTEPIVNQLTMIRGFSGSGRVLSFLAPYVCVSCGGAFQRLVDAEADAEAVRAQVPPPASCPKCGNEGRFDDDPRSYFAIASLLAEQVPAAVRAATGPVSPVGRPALEKRVDDGITHLAVNGALSPTLRWRNALEGVDGRLRVDLANVAIVEPEAVRPMLGALRTVLPDVRSVELDVVPLSLAPALRAESWIDVRSWQFDAVCATCSRSTLVVRPSDRLADAARGLGTGACACGGTLQVPLDALGLLAAAAEVAALARPGTQTQTRPLAFTPPAPANPETPAPLLRLVLGIGLVTVGAVGLLSLVLGLAGVGLLAHGVAQPAAVVSVPATAPELGPWTIGPDVVVAVGQGTGGTVEEASAAARSEALWVLVRGAVAEVPRAADPDAGQDGAVDRYLAAFGAIGTPERRDLRVEEGPQTKVVPAYGLSRVAFDEVVSQLTPIEVGALRLAPPLPVEAWSGLRVVASSDPDVPVGARVTAVEDQVLRPRDRPTDLSGARLTLVMPNGEERSVRLP